MDREVVVVVTRTGGVKPTFGVAGNGCLGMTIDVGLSPATCR